MCNDPFPDGSKYSLTAGHEWPNHPTLHPDRRVQQVLGKETSNLPGLGLMSPHVTFSTLVPGLTLPSVAQVGKGAMCVQRKVLQNKGGGIPNSKKAGAGAGRTTHLTLILAGLSPLATAVQMTPNLETKLWS